MSSFIDRRTLLASSLALPLTYRFCAAEEEVTPSPPELLDPTKGIRGGWTIVLFPDTQNYAKYGKNQQHFERMCRWTVENLDRWRIKLALHEGDLVEQNGIEVGGGRGWGDQHSQSQWESAKRALARLEGMIPTIFATGNHDYGVRNAEDRTTRFNEFFPLTANPLTSDGRGGGIFLEGGPNAFGEKTAENAAYSYRGPDGRKLLITALEWGPRREAVAWAKDVFARKEFSDHTGVLLTHDFLTPASLRDGNVTSLRDGQDGNRKRSGNPHTYPTGREGNTHDGEDLWQTLVRESPCVELVFNGHEMGSHVGRRTDLNAVGVPVHQMLFNAQGLGGGSDEKGNGGDGWMRLLTFEEDGETLSVRTFSPLKLDAGKSPWWDDPSWRFAVKLRPI